MSVMTRNRIEEIDLSEVPSRHRRRARSLLAHGPAYLEYRRYADGTTNTFPVSTARDVGTVGNGWVTTCVEEINDDTPEEE